MTSAVSRLALAAAIPFLGLAPLSAAFAQTGPTPAQISSARPDSTAHPALWPHAQSPAAKHGVKRLCSDEATIQAVAAQRRWQRLGT